MQTDRELLELAAKAIGLNTGTDEGSYDDLKWWNPLESTRAAFDLMVRLELEVSFGDRYFFAEGKMSFCGEYWIQTNLVILNILFYTVMILVLQPVE